MVETVLSLRRYPTTRTVAVGTLWNVLGRAVPQLVALITIPLLINMLGPSRFGIFALAMALIGVSGLVDLGIGRALTRGVAERLHAEHEDQAAVLVKTGLLVLGCLGIVSGLVAASLAHTLAYHVINVPAELRHETEMALYVICMTIPLVVLNSALWGVITALDLFRPGNLASGTIVALSYAGQLLILYVFNSLAAVMLVFFASRIVSLLAYWKLCRDAMPKLATSRIDRADIRPLLRIGGWMTVSNIVFPILGCIDRFMIAMVLSAAAVGYYATPSELMGRVHIITGATMISLFPAIAASYRINPLGATALFGRSIITMCAVLFPVAAVAGAFSNELLTLWVGADYASNAAPVLRILAASTLLAAADGIVVTLLDAIGLPKINAKFSVVELILYVPLLFLALHLFGYVGAAVAYVVRVAIDFHVRLWLAGKFYPAIAPTGRRVALTALTGTALLLAPSLVSGLAARCVGVCLVTAVFAAVVYTRSATAEERLRFRSQLSAMWSRLPAGRAASRIWRGAR
jgi:O-antigen/teichoic acid export membrane protein